MSTEQSESAPPQVDPTQQATTPTATTTSQRKKNPKCVAAGKLVVERTRQAREQQKIVAAVVSIIIENNKVKAATAEPAPTTEGGEKNSSLSTIQWLAVGTVVDVASRYKEAEPLTSKNSDEVAKAFQTIYSRSPGREFMGAVTQEMEKHKTYIQRGRAEIHRDQAIVERFNRTLAERLFGHQYAVEMRLPEGQRSTAWVKRLPEVVSALNNEVTSLIGKKPAVAIKEKTVYARPSTAYSRPVGESEKILPSLVQVRYLYQPGELEGGAKGATDLIWSLKVYSIERSFTKPHQPVLYYLRDGPKRSFVREELLVVPPNTTFPPAAVN